MAEDWVARMHRGLLELCILGLLENQSSYGYEIVTRLANTPRLAVNEGTVYPLLRKLKGLGWLATYWEESDSGPPRQYYKISKKGNGKLVELRSEWAGLVAEVDEILSTNTQSSSTDQLREA